MHLMQRFEPMPPFPRTRFGDHVPPAIFPPVFGLMGLGLAWRRAAEILPLPHEISDLILGAGGALFVFMAFAYGLKFARRPGVLAEDLRVLPGRGGLAALALGFYVLAAALVAYWPGLARVVLALGLVLHLALLLAVLRFLATAPTEQRVVTPIWHLNFVGFIIAPLAAVPLGLTGPSEFVLWGSGTVALAIFVASARQFARMVPPPPLRPLLAIHLAPLSLLGTVALLLGHVGLATGLGVAGGGLLALFLGRVGWLTEAGFSPLWGAFTFPLAAYGTLCLLLAAAGRGQVFLGLGAGVLLLASVLIPFVTYKVVQMWMRGALAAKTNAARV